MDGGVVVGPGDASRTLRSILFLRRMVDQRLWLHYLRHTAIVRALMPDGETLASARVMEAADQLCDVLDGTPLPVGDRRGAVQRSVRWSREKLTRGLRFPEYTGGARETFTARFIGWVCQAASSEAGRRALDHAGYFIGSDGRETRFAIAVRHEVDGLLAEPRRPEGQNRVRRAMADELQRGTSEQEVRDRHEALRFWIRTITAGVLAAVSTELIWIDNWTNSMTVGALAVGGQVVAEYTQQHVYRTPALMAVRRQVKYWLDTLDRVARQAAWTADPKRKELLGEANENGRRELEAPNLRPSLMALLREVSRTEVAVHAHPSAASLMAPIEHLQSLIKKAQEVGDQELWGALYELESGFTLAPQVALSSYLAVSLLVDEAPPP
ncbi:hypothetical protein [Streptomyces sp. URMC 124]|uniref:hypothetical protein n=1 Tax=Streptomyces sp. URMC 124 TaxID=3423405 RepID=UPI003F1B8718